MPGSPPLAKDDVSGAQGWHPQPEMTSHLTKNKKIMTSIDLLQNNPIQTIEKPKAPAVKTNVQQVKFKEVLDGVVVKAKEVIPASKQGSMDSRFELRNDVKGEGNNITGSHARQKLALDDVTASRATIDKDGTDFALKEVSIEMEKQMLGIMWNLAFTSDNKKYEGGLGEEIFQGELVNELVNSSQKKGEMGDIAKSIYNNLKREKTIE